MFFSGYESIRNLAMWDYLSWTWVWCNYSQLKANSLSAWSAVLITLLLQCSSIHGCHLYSRGKSMGKMREWGWGDMKENEGGWGSIRRSMKAYMRRMREYFYVVWERILEYMREEEGFQDEWCGSIWVRMKDDEGVYEWGWRTVREDDWWWGSIWGRMSEDEGVYERGWVRMRSIWGRMRVSWGRMLKYKEAWTSIWTRMQRPNS